MNHVEKLHRAAALLLCSGPIRCKPHTVSLLLLKAGPFCLRPLATRFSPKTPRALRPQNSRHAGCSADLCFTAIKLDAARRAACVQLFGFGDADVIVVQGLMSVGPRCLRCGTENNSLAAKGKGADPTAVPLFRLYRST